MMNILPPARFILTGQESTKPSAVPSLVESIEATMKLVAEDQVATSALRLSLRAAAIQLASASLIRVPLHRLLKQSGKLTGLALVLVIIGVLALAGLRQLLGVDALMSPTWVWVLSGSVAIGFFLAYRGALSEHRSAFVAEVLDRDGINLDVVRRYNRSFNHQGSDAAPIEEARDGHNNANEAQ
jgi:hypothetical protein